MGKKKKEFGAIVPRRKERETIFTQTGHADVSVAQEQEQETKKKTQTHAPLPQNGVCEINKHAAIAGNGRASGLSFVFFPPLRKCLHAQIVNHELNDMGITTPPLCLALHNASWGRLHFCSRGFCELEGNFLHFSMYPHMLLRNLEIPILQV